ncbi:hypothetical protein BpHYR1_050164, partial [Brachionus plicatilis]
MFINQVERGSNVCYACNSYLTSSLAGPAGQFPAYGRRCDIAASSTSLETTITLPLAGPKPRMRKEEGGGSHTMWSST